MVAGGSAAGDHASLRAASRGAYLPPAMNPMPPAGAPGPQGFRPSRPRRPWGWIALAVLLAAVVAAAVGSTVTYVAMRNDQACARLRASDRVAVLSGGGTAIQLG